MIRKFHQARKHEEGQALAIACISMLILALCILATVNLAYAAKHRVQVQNAADAAAYNTAAHEARALNLLAYTNRAMVVHYVSQMDLMAIVSYANFNVTVITLITSLLAKIPYIGFLFTIIGYIFIALAILILVAVFVLIPLIDGTTYRLSLAEAGIVQGMQARIADGGATEVKKFNSGYVTTNLAKTLLDIDDNERWGASGNMVSIDPKFTVRAAEANTGTAAFERLMMVEMANAARPKFTAYGDSKKWSVFIFPRMIPGVSCPPRGIACIDKTARTEWGSFYADAQPSGLGGIINQYLLGNFFTNTEQIFSLDRFKLMFKILGYAFGFKLDSYAKADRTSLLTSLVGIISALFNLGPMGMPSAYVSFDSIIPSGGGLVGAIIGGIVRAIITPVVKTVQQYVNQNTLPWPILQFLPLVHFGQWPYAKFRPIPTTGGTATNPSATVGASQLFNQPPVLTMVTAPKATLNANGRPFLGGFGFRLGNFRASGRPTDTAYTQKRNDRPTKRGYVDKVTFAMGDSPLAFTTVPGFHAVSAAMAYYHRPGDWREPPNLFNPMWGAKLMPVMDYPTITQNGAMADLLGKRLVVH